MENQINFFNARGRAGRGGSYNNNRGGRGRGRGQGSATSIRPNFSNNSFPPRGKYTQPGNTFTSKRASWPETADIGPTSSKTADSLVLGTRRSGNALITHKKGASGFVGNQSTFNASTSRRFDHQEYNTNQSTSNTEFNNKQQGYNKNQSISGTGGFYNNQQGYNKNQRNARFDKDQSFEKGFQANNNESFSSSYVRYPPSSVNKSQYKPFDLNTQAKQELPSTGYRFDLYKKFPSLNDRPAKLEHSAPSFIPFNEDMPSEQVSGGGFRKSAPTNNRFAPGFTKNVQPEPKRFEEEEFSPVYNRREPSDGGFGKQIFSRGSNKNLIPTFTKDFNREAKEEFSLGLSSNQPAVTQRFKPPAKDFGRGDLDEDYSPGFNSNRSAVAQRFKPLSKDFSGGDPPRFTTKHPTIAQLYKPTTDDEDNSPNPSPDRSFGRNNSFKRGGFHSRDDPPEVKFNRDDPPVEIYNKSRDSSWKGKRGSNSYGRYEPPEVRNEPLEEVYDLSEDYPQEQEGRFDPPEEDEEDFATDNSYKQEDCPEETFGREKVIHKTAQYPRGEGKNTFSRYEPPEGRYNQNEEERFSRNRSFSTDHHAGGRFDREDNINRGRTERGRDDSFNRDLNFDEDDGDDNERDDSYNRDHPKRGRSNRDNSFNRGERFNKDDSFNHPRGERFYKDDHPKGGRYNRDDSFNKYHYESKDYSAKRKFNTDDSFNKNRDERFYRDDHFERDDSLERERTDRFHSPKRRFNKERPFKRGRSPEERYNRKSYEHYQPRYSPPSPEVTFDPPPREGRFSPPDQVSSWEEQPEQVHSPPVPYPLSNPENYNVMSKKKFKQAERMKKAVKVRTYNPRLIPPNPTIKWKLKNLFGRIKIVPVVPVVKFSKTGEVLDDWYDCAVVHAEHPMKNLKGKKQTAIKKQVRYGVNSVPPGASPPRFKINVQQLGYVQVKCLDLATKAWLENIIQTYQDETEIPLKVIDIKDLYRKAMMLNIPGSPPPTTEDVLKKIAEENSVDTSLWQVVRNPNTAKGVHLVVFVPSTEYKKIEGLGGKILYDSKELSFTLVQ